MQSKSCSDRYILVSPVKDEEKYVETTIRSVIQQTIKPVRWVIVDDGSRDRTTEIIQRYGQEFPWIMVVRLDHKSQREPGSPVINAFNAGYELVRDSDVDFVVKFDCDLDLPADYFEKLIQHFRADNKLGIASGMYMERGSNGWHLIPMPDYHAAGATKMMRVRCFREIGGFVSSRGWDTVDEIKAQARGWTTRHFDDLRFRHLKNEGAGIGNLRTNEMHGEIYYITGGPKTFFLLKALHRCVVGKPAVLGGLFMLRGYLKAWSSRKQLLVTEREAESYRHLLNKRILDGLSRMFHWNSSKQTDWRFS